MQIFSIGQTKNIALYTVKNGIFQCLLEGGQTSRPVLAANDYQNSLTATAHHFAIYFSYMGTENQLSIHNLSDRNDTYRIVEMEGRTIYHPFLLSWNDHLLVFYVVGNGTYEIVGFFVGENRHTRLPFIFPYIPSFTCHNLSGHVLVCIHTQPGMVYRFSEEAGWEKLQTDSDTKIPELTEQLRQKDQLIQSIQAQYEELRNTALQYRDEAKKWYEKATR